MNKKTRIYILILVALVIIYLISQIDNKTEKRFKFFNADSNSVARFEISTLNDTLYLVKSGSEWKMDYPVKWSLQDGKIDKLMKSVLTAETSTIPVSEKTESLEQYDLTDSLATHFRTLDSNGKVLDNVFIGRSSNYNVTPVRKIDSNKVYLLENSISYMIKPQANSWRRREIVDLDPEQITKFMVVSDEATYTLTFLDSLWVYEDENENFTVKDDNSNINTLKNTFKRFASTDFVDGDFSKYEEALANPTMELGLETFEGQSYYFRYAPYEEKKYVVQLNNETETLYIQYESNMKKFLKKAEDFK